MLTVRGIYDHGQIMLKEKISSSRKIPVFITFLEEPVSFLLSSSLLCFFSSFFYVRGPTLRFFASPFFYFAVMV
jgi:hypothetical protein